MRGWDLRATIRGKGVVHGATADGYAELVCARGVKRNPPIRFRGLIDGFGFLGPS